MKFYFSPKVKFQFNNTVINMRQWLTRCRIYKFNRSIGILYEEYAIKELNISSIIVMFHLHHIYDIEWGHFSSVVAARWASDQQVLLLRPVSYIPFVSLAQAVSRPYHPNICTKRPDTPLIHS